MFSRRLYAVLTAGLLVGGVSACDDNAEDHLDEAAEEQAEGDYEDAQESRIDAQQDLQQGDTTELLN